MDLSQRLAGQVAVITGGGSGDGATAGRGWAERRRSCRRRRRRASGAAADGLSGLFVPTDVCDEDAVNGLFDKQPKPTATHRYCVQRFRHLTTGDNLIENTELAAWRSKTSAQSRCACAFARRPCATWCLLGKAPSLTRRPSVMGSATVDLLPHRLKNLECWLCHGNWAECNSLGRHQVNALCPGPVNTHCCKSFSPEPGTGRSPHELRNRWAVRQPDEIAAAVAF